MPAQAPVCVFDVNETLLDMSALDPLFDRLFGRPGVRREWFAQLIQSSMVGTITRAYQDFDIVGRAALAMIAARHAVELGASDADRVMDGLASLPPQPDAIGALSRLSGAGFRQAALTNNPVSLVEAQLHHAELNGFFEKVLSCEAVQQAKPAPDVYWMAARELGAEIGDLLLIAAHSWDVAGAMRAGASGALVLRPGVVLDPLAPRPQITGHDLIEVADEILRRGPVAQRNPTEAR